MNKILFSLIFIFTMSVSFAQVTEKEDDLKKRTEAKSEGWNTGGIFNMNFSQVAFKNWSAGGLNSMGLTALASFHANYAKGNMTWDNNLDLAYGILRQGKDKNIMVMKTDDKIDFSSKFGMKAADKLYYAALVSFKTQFTEGYEYPNDSVAISNLMAPAYLLGALGIDYKPNKNLSIFFAPVTAKITFVNDQNLANAGAFGVEKAVIDTITGNIITAGKTIRNEFGGYLKIAYQKELMKNISLQTKIDFFSNYLNNPQNIDVSWEMLINMKVNKYFTASLGTNLLYDHDITINEKQTDGTFKPVNSKIQFKEVLAIGFAYKF